MHLTFRTAISLAITLVLCAGSSLTGQTRINSPYSRTGLGDFNEVNFAQLAAKGGIGTALIHPFQLNLENPASLGFLHTATFDVGFQASYQSLTTGSGTTSYGAGNLSNMALGLPLKNKVNEALDKIQTDWDFGLAFSLQPYTTVGYKIRSYENIPELDSIRREFEGNGGTYRFNLSTGARYKRLGFGLDLGYLFGKVTEDQEAYFTNIGNYYSDQSRTVTGISGFSSRIGLIYDGSVRQLKTKEGELAERNGWVFGLTAQANTAFRTRTDGTFYRVNSRYVGSLDTLLTISDLEREGTLPARIAIGVNYIHKNRAQFGIDIARGFWSAYESDAFPMKTRDTWRLGLGASWIGKKASFRKNYDRLTYQAGLFYREDPRVISQNINQYGVTIGLSLPVIVARQETSYLHLGLEVGRSGHPEGIDQVYGRLNIGFSLNDNSWFFKRKYN